MCAILSNRLETFAQKICRCFEWNHLAALTFLKIFWGSLTFSLKNLATVKKEGKRTSKKIFKKTKKKNIGEENRPKRKIKVKLAV